MKCHLRWEEKRVIFNHLLLFILIIAIFFLHFITDQFQTRQVTRRWKILEEYAYFREKNVDHKADSFLISALSLAIEISRYNNAITPMIWFPLFHEKLLITIFLIPFYTFYAKSRNFDCEFSQDYDDLFFVIFKVNKNNIILNNLILH